MSIRLMSQVWEKDLSHSAQAVLLAMADYADDNGRNCYPSYERLAWKTGYSSRQVQRIIKDLCALGILEVVSKPTQHQSARYWIRLEKAQSKPPFRDDTMSTLDEPRVDTMSTLNEPRVDKCDIQSRQMRHPGWTNETSRVDTMSTDPSYNHHTEPPLKKDDDDNAREAHGAVFTAWAENIPGTMAPILGDRLHDLIDECGPPAVIYGIVASVEAGARNFKYIAACARNNAAGKEAPARASPSANGGGYRGPAQSKTDRKRDAFANVERMLQEEGLSS